MRFSLRKLFIAMTAAAVGVYLAIEAGNPFYSPLVLGCALVGVMAYLAPSAHELFHRQ